MATGRVLITLVVTALLIAVNWLVYIYAIVSGHVLEGSLGYYLNPLVNVLLGVFLLKERLSPRRRSSPACSPPPASPCSRRGPARAFGSA